MSSFIYEKPKDSGRYYFRCTTADGEKVHESLSKRFGLLNAPQLDLLTTIVNAVRGMPPAARPGPNGSTPRAPNGLKTCSPEKAIEIALAALKSDVEQGILSGSTEVQRRSQFNMALKGLGGRSWAQWLGKKNESGTIQGGWYHWLVMVRKYPERTRTNYKASAAYMIRKCKEAGYHVPDFLSEAPEIKMTPALSKGIRKGQPSRRAPKETYSVDEMRAVIRAVVGHKDIYLRLIYSIICYAGMSPVDANYMLAGEFEEGEGFKWSKGTYSYIRTKVERENMEIRTIPLAPSLLALLEPYKVGKRGIRIPSARPSEDWHNKTSNFVRDNWKTVEEEADVETIKGHILKRPRHTMHVTLRMKAPKGFSLGRTERYHLMGWAYKNKGERIDSHYDEVDMDACVEAVAKWDALISGG